MSVQKKIGIYLIINTLDGRVYVGSSMDIRQRFSMHRSYLRRGCHPNAHLQRAWSKYGEGAFEIRIVEECVEELLEVREQFWINHYDSMNDNKGYNFRKADRHGRLTEEHKRKISEAHRGMTYSEETKKRLSEINRGRKLSDEHRRKLSEAHRGNQYNKGKHPSEETRRKIGDAHRGLRRSDETRRKISEANKGKVISPEHRSAVSEANRRRMITDETRRKMSESRKGRIAWNKGKHYRHIRNRNFVIENTVTHPVETEIKPAQAVA
jgi:group I intron endonuclease